MKNAPSSRVREIFRKVGIWAWILQKDAGNFPHSAKEGRIVISVKPLN